MWLTVHPFDPWGTKTGGIETYIRLMLRHAPDGLDIGVIGISEDAVARPPRQWTRLDLGGRHVWFYPLYRSSSAAGRTVMPDTLRFAMALPMAPRAAYPWIVHRIELAWVLPRGGGKLLFVHSDPREWVSPESEVRWRFIPSVYYWLERMALRTVESIYCVNRSSVGYFQAQGELGSNHVNHVRTTFDDRLCVPRMAADRGRQRQALFPESWSTQVPLVLFVGRLERQKNPALAIESFLALTATVPEARMVMLGDGDERERLRRLVARLGLQHQVWFAGAVPNAAVVSWLQAGDVLLMTSRFEGMPITLLESLACGTPVVASAVGEIPTVLRRGGGTLVDNQNPNAYAEAMVPFLGRRDDSVSDSCLRAVEAYTPHAVMPAVWQSIISRV